jgi:hypothetical protein
MILSICGKIQYRRVKYVCVGCGEIYYLFDQELEVGRSMTSKRLCKIATMLFTFMPYAHTKKVLNDMIRVGISETALISISNRIGTKLYNDMDKKSQRPEQIKSLADEVGVLYIQGDGAMTPIMGDGCLEYKENKLGVVYTDKDIVHKKTKKGKDRVEIKNKRFVSSIGEGVEKFKRMLHARAKESGLYKAEVVVLLGDGAVWLSKMKDEYFQNAIQILDWYHAVDHLWATAHALFGEENIEKCKNWVEPLKELLWHGQIDEVITWVAKTAKSAKKNQTHLYQLHGYLVSNKNHMKYDEYRNAGYYIGSGAIESANKYIVANRLKLAGMRWDVRNANSMIWLRSKYFEDDWDKFWEEMNISEYLTKHANLWGSDLAA